MHRGCLRAPECLATGPAHARASSELSDGVAVRRRPPSVPAGPVAHPTIGSALGRATTGQIIYRVNLIRRGRGDMRRYVFGGLALALACSPLISILPAAAASAQGGMGSRSALTSGSTAALNPNQDGVNPANSTLTGISCVTASFCMAVGWTFEGEDQSVQISYWST